jgi:hypothetical protein
MTIDSRHLVDDIYPKPEFEAATRIGGPELESDVN